ncbi:MAG: FMN-binding negative transcriptional regulator [Planctomycetota bacterium]
MYTPPPFRIDDPDTLHRFIRAHSFATLMTPSDEGLQITHLPLLIEPEAGPHGTLRGHFAKANPHAQRISTGAPTTAIFHGPHAYVSPHDYSGQTPAVPTWNYAVVHAHGTLNALADDSELTQHLAEIVETYETGSPNPWAYDADSDLNRGLLRAIVGFELPIQHFEGKFKLGQNRSAEDQSAMLEALQQGSVEGQALAEFIQKFNG